MIISIIITILNFPIKLVIGILLGVLKAVDDLVYYIEYYYAVFYVDKPRLDRLIAEKEKHIKNNNAHEKKEWESDKSFIDTINSFLP